MSRLTSRSHNFMALQNRSDYLSTAFLTSRKFKPNTMKLKPNKASASNNQLDIDNLNSYYNIKEGKFNSPFTGTISIPRGTFQLSSPPPIRLIESSSTPIIQQKQNIHLKVISDMQSMIPNSTKSRRNLKQAMRTSVRHITQLKLKSEVFGSISPLISMIPYSRPNSRLFFRYCKEGNMMKIEIMLTQDKSLAFVFDPMQMTALHWATLRGYYEMVKILISFNANVDAIDCSHRTPLHIASKAGDSRILQELLKNNADPMIVTNTKQTVWSLAKSEVIKDVLRRYAKEKVMEALN